MAERGRDRRAVFLDTGFSSLSSIDRIDITSRRPSVLGSPPHRWFTSLAVVSETYGWFLHRLGEEAARAFGWSWGISRVSICWPIDADHHAAVVRSSSACGGHKLTYVDASSLVFSALANREVWDRQGSCSSRRAGLTHRSNRFFSICRSSDRFIASHHPGVQPDTAHIGRTHHRCQGLPILANK